MSEPEDASELLRQGQMAFQSGRIDLAISLSRRAIDIAPDRSDGYFNLGVCFERKGDREQAISCFSHCVSLDPDSQTFRGKLGLYLFQLGRYKEALRLYSEGIALHSDQVQWLIGLGRAQEALGEFDAAIKAYEKALDLSPGPEGFVRLASVFLLAKKPTGALSALRKALDLDPNSAISLSMMGNVLQEVGQFEESIEFYRQALRIDPNQTLSYYKMVRAGFGDLALVSEMEAALLRPTTPEMKRHLHYALGKSFEDSTDFERAISHYDRANTLSREVQFGRTSFPEAETNRMFDLVTKTFTKESLGKWSSLGNPSATPIFIVGMIRSGTTLVEQMLSSHPAVAAGGEQPFLLKEGEAVLKQAVEDKLDPGSVANLQTAYLALLSRLGNGTGRVTDKLPNNYMLLGLIQLLFPNARIVHCFRNSSDNALSIWTTPFTDPPKFAYVRSSIASMFGHYQRLMEHWRKELPSPAMIEIRYEDLVQEPEPAVRSLLEFCGLDWDDRCLHPESNPRVVSTPSAWQVRQPLYTSSIGRWRRFEPWLGEFSPERMGKQI